MENPEILPSEEAAEWIRQGMDEMMQQQQPQDVGRDDTYQEADQRPQETPESSPENQGVPERRTTAIVLAIASIANGGTPARYDRSGGGGCRF